MDPPICLKVATILEKPPPSTQKPWTSNDISFVITSINFKWNGIFDHKIWSENALNNCSYCMQKDESSIMFIKAILADTYAGQMKL